MITLVRFGRATLGAACALALAGSVAAQVAPNERTARTLQLARFVVPDFPPFLRQSGVLQGTVVAAIGRDAEGVVSDVLILESTDARFADVSAEAIWEWRFKPADAAALAGATGVPVVRFLFTTGAVAMVPLAAAPRSGARRAVRAETPVELPNFSHLDHPPRRLRGAEPEFPPALRGKLGGGTVVLKYFVDGDGRVRLPTVITANPPEFAAAALTALRTWQYEPPRIDGRPVIALERHSFQFGAVGP